MARRLSSCGPHALEHWVSNSGAQAQLLQGMWDPPGPGTNQCPSLAGRFLTAGPTGKHEVFDF